MYLVSLTGKGCFHDRISICVINSLSFLDKVRQLIKKRYGLEFAEQSFKHIGNTRFFDNITNNRDITLEVEVIGGEDYVITMLA